MEPEEFLMRGYEETIHNLRTEIARLKALVREMVPLVEYLDSIPLMDTVSWAPDNKMKKLIKAILSRPEVREIITENKDG